MHRMTRVPTGGVEDEHLCSRRDGALELVKVDGPFGGREGLDVAFFGRVHRDVDDLAAGHLDVANVPRRDKNMRQMRFAMTLNHPLVKEGLKDDDLVPWLDESHEGAQHA